jgi:hypothetical protein
MLHASDLTSGDVYSSGMHVQLNLAMMSWKGPNSLCHYKQVLL